MGISGRSSWARNRRSQLFKQVKKTKTSAIEILVIITQDVGLQASWVVCSKTLANLYYCLAAGICSPCLTPFCASLTFFYTKSCFNQLFLWFPPGVRIHRPIVSYNWGSVGFPGTSIPLSFDLYQTSAESCWSSLCVFLMAEAWAPCREGSALMEGRAAWG